MTLAIIGGVIAYLAAGLGISRAYWQRCKRAGGHTDEGQDIVATFMVPFWPAILLFMGATWFVAHEPKEISR